MEDLNKKLLRYIFWTLFFLRVGVFYLIQVSNKLVPRLIVRNKRISCQDLKFEVSLIFTWLLPALLLSHRHKNHSLIVFFISWCGIFCFRITLFFFSRNNFFVFQCQFSFFSVFKHHVNAKTRHVDFKLQRLFIFREIFRIHFNNDICWAAFNIAFTNIDGYFFSWILSIFYDKAVIIDSFHVFVLDPLSLIKDSFYVLLCFFKFFFAVICDVLAHLLSSL